MHRTYPLELIDGHLYIRLGPEWYLIDTGSASSFSARGMVSILGESFRLPKRLSQTVTIEWLREKTGQPQLAGLLGNDVLQHFDHLWDLPAAQATLSIDELGMSGDVVRLKGKTLRTFKVEVDGRSYRPLWDTGAKVSYFADRELAKTPYLGMTRDFHASIGDYDTPTHRMSMKIGKTHVTLRCASFKPLGWDHSDGIIGSDLIKGRKALYAPRRNCLVLAA